MSPGPDPRTSRGRAGRDAEGVAQRFLAARGWRILARNLVIGRDEIDLVCLDPDGPALVCVEVRGHATSRFGAAEESVDRRKLASIQRAALALARSGWIEQHDMPACILVRVDLMAVELRPSLRRDLGGASVRHIRGLTLD